MYAAIRRYLTDPDSIDEVARRVNEGFVPLVSDMQGFVAYFALNAGMLVAIDLVTPGDLRAVVCTPGRVLPLAVVSAASTLSISAIVCASIA